MSIIPHDCFIKQTAYKLCCFFIVILSFQGCQTYSNFEQATVIKLSPNKTIIYPYKSNLYTRYLMKKSFTKFSFQIIDSSKIELCSYIGLDTLYQFYSTLGSNIALVSGNTESVIIIKDKFRKGCACNPNDINK